MNYLSLFLNLLNMTVENAAPYLLITIGGVFVARAGVFNINIAQLSKYLDMALLDGVTPTLQGHYDALEHHAGECIGCGRCETQCPFNVPIMQRMKQAAELFGK